MIVFPHTPKIGSQYDLTCTTAGFVLLAADSFLTPFLCKEKVYQKKQGKKYYKIKRKAVPKKKTSKNITKNVLKENN